MAIPITWGTFPNMPADGDVIELRDVVKPGLGSKIQFNLACTPNIDWKKELKLYNGTGQLIATIQVEGPGNCGPHSTTFERTAIAKMELCKSKAGGIMTGMYEITDFDPKSGHDLTFVWKRH